MGFAERLTEVMETESGVRVLSVEEAKRYLAFFSERGMTPGLYFRPHHTFSPVFPHHDPDRFIQHWQEQFGMDYLAFIGHEEEGKPRYLYILHNCDAAVAFTIYVCGRPPKGSTIDRALVNLGIQRRVGELREGVPQRFVDDILRRGWIKESNGKRWAVEVL